ncbi:MAG: peptidoglycan DD-metalloendopeptidase family protein, partial [Atopostipes sp.]|nr:peptidoglycan DD-metalloendopeptidase family protein [Atopostipes sp.]
TMIQESISDLVTDIEKQEKELKNLEEEIDQLNEEIEVLQEKIDERNHVLADQARGLQTGGSPENLLDLFLSSDNLTDLIGKIEVVNLVVKNNNTIMEEQERDQAQVKEHKETVDLAKEEVLLVKENLEKDHASLKVQKDDLDNKVETVSEEYSLTKSEKRAMESNQEDINQKSNRLQNRIQTEKEKIAAEKARKQKEEEKRKARAKAKEKEKDKKVEISSSKTSPKPSSKPSNQPAKKPDKKPENKPNDKPDNKPNNKPSDQPNSKGWTRPANGYISSEFGYRTHPIYGTKRLHGGIDIAGGGTIKAAKSGTVTVAQKHPTWGNYVKIDHGNGVSSLYAHMQPGLKVSAGQSVSQGQALGIMGTTGSSTGVHLHFEIYEGLERVNPRNYVNF